MDQVIYRMLCKLLISLYQIKIEKTVFITKLAKITNNIDPTI